MRRTLAYLWLVVGLCSSEVLGAPTSSRELTLLDAAAESLTGDVYAEPSKWHDLSLGTFFTEGWNEPWASPPPGEGGAPRQGWLNAADGVFYRLFIFTYGYAADFHDNGHQNAGAFTIYLPLSARLELRADLPLLVSNRGGSDNDYHTAAGDMQITPRFILSETRALTQSFNVTFRMPTGNVDNGNGVTAITPTYEFWSNCWRGLVVRGGAGMSVPYSNQGVREVGARTTFIGNLSAGYYFTPHDLTPVGDLVWYVATNLAQATDNRGPNTTTLTFTPGFRTHLGRDFYLLGGVEVPATVPRPFDYQVLGGLMKVF